MSALDILLEQITDKVNQLKDWLGSGQAIDFNEYQRMAGEIKGLLFCRQNILDLKQRMEHSDDE
jgi:hypothetical protein